MEAARAAASSAVAAVSQHASDASKAVQNVVGTATLTAACKMAEIEIKKRSGKAIEIVCAENIPAEWVSWIRTTGINSLCANDTWSFLEDSSYNARKVTMWHERDMTKIIIDVARDPEEFTESWKICEVVYEPGAHEFTLLWYPRAKTLESPATWVERGGDRRYWNLSTHIPFGLGIQQLPGPTFYKSDWVDNFEDADPDSYFDKGTTTFRRWLQFRHWTLVWYARAVPNWNHQWCTIPPRMEDGREFEFHSVVELPTMPGFEIPTNIQTPTLEDVKMPNGQTQQLNPNEPPATEGNNDGAATGEEDKNNKKLPKRKHRPTNPYAAHGFIELVGLHAVAKGNKLILTEATVVNFWEVEGKIEVERREKQRMELKCSSKEQADSWAQSLCRAGAVNDEVTACCVVA